MIRPARFDLLPRLRRADCTVLRRLRAQLGGGARAALRRWAEDHVGAADGVEVRARPCAADAERRRRLLESAAMTLQLQGPEGRRAALALDSRSVAALVALLLHTTPQTSAGPLSPAERAIVTYAVAGLLLELEACSWSIVDGEAPKGGGCGRRGEAPGRGEPPRGERAPCAPWNERAPCAPGTEAPSLAGTVVVEVELALRGRVSPEGGGGARRVGLGWLVVEEAALVAPPRPATGAPPLLGRLTGVRMTVPVELGRLRLAACELPLLGAGDVIVSPDCPRRSAEQAAVLRVGAGGLAAVVDERGGQVRIVAPYSRGGGFGMSTQGTEHPSRLADDLPVEVVVEVGRLQLTGAQVLELGTGDVLTLDRALGPVELRVGDRLIARGELVDVEGEAGVRLSEVFD
jgi:type III secretion system YscQ/HrcQ family protein